MVEPKVRTSCTYRVLQLIALHGGGVPGAGSFVGPGEIVDLSDSTDECINWLLTAGYIETADGTPVNQPLGTRARKPCPCQEKRATGDK